MCGIVGIYNHQKDQTVSQQILSQMLAMIRHRGPDEFGLYMGDFIGLGSARLSIIDIATGQQPITNEDQSCWIVFNGEIFNYIELRDELEQRGHRFRTQSDTEVILHLYEEYGVECLSRLNGQFAIAIWDSHQERLLLARDRLGIRPLFYTQQAGRLIFASEIKALIAHPAIQPQLDIDSLNQIFTFWTTLSPNTAFQDIYEVPPGHFLVAHGEETTVEAYWQLSFDSVNQQDVTTETYLEQLHDLLVDATQIRLRSDVPVGAYLSGGLDSSLTASIIRHYTKNRLDTFSISFEDAEFDESPYQIQMAQLLDTHHQVTHTTHADIGDIFPEVIWHTEIPILRTAPAPMYFLSKLAHEHRYKVVMTGEGADEFFGGYNIFKETMVRHFWAKQPDSTIRPLLLQKLYPYLNQSSRNRAFFQAFFAQYLTDTDLNYYSHILRWNNASRLKRIFSKDVQTQLESSVNPIDLLQDHLQFPTNFDRYHPLEKAQYLESKIFMSQYLLSSQGDRMSAANSVEGRYPFLDHRVVEFATGLPAHLKLRHLNEKYLLKQLAKKWLPDSIWNRKKQPYRAPIIKSFFHDKTPDYVEAMLSDVAINRAGIFDVKAVQQLQKKINRGMPLGETDNMALAGILSTQLLYDKFIHTVDMPPPITPTDYTTAIMDRSQNKENNA